MLNTLKRHEIYVVAAVIGVVFVTAMGTVAWMLRSSIVGTPYESLSGRDLKSVFATGYLRYREDDGTPYLKVEIHNGTLWWIKKVEFDFDGTRYALSDADAFRPLHFGARRCLLKRKPAPGVSREYDLRILKAYGYPPAELEWKRKARKLASDSRR
jgi:hypothetical protein